jgi:ABC-2 type transport system ATP-binding protein
MVAILLVLPYVLDRYWLGIAAFSLGQPSLDEVFLALTGHPAEEDESVEAPA